MEKLLGQNQVNKQENLHQTTKKVEKTHLSEIKHETKDVYFLRKYKRSFYEKNYTEKRSI